MAWLQALFLMAEPKQNMVKYQSSWPILERNPFPAPARTLGCLRHDILCPNNNFAAFCSMPKNPVFFHSQNSNETMSCLRSLFRGFLAGPPNHPNHLNHLNHLTIHDLVLKPMTWGSSNFKKPPFSHLPSGYLT